MNEMRVPRVREANLGLSFFPYEPQMTRRIWGTRILAGAKTDLATHPSRLRKGWKGIYSNRNAAIGSICDARIAGTTHAMIAVSSRHPTIMVNTTGSAGFVP